MEKAPQEKEPKAPKVVGSNVKMVGRTFTPLTARDNITRCLYLFPAGVQCFRNGEQLVNEPGPPRVTYQLCNSHANILKAIDAGTMTGTGSQQTDQRLPPAINDDGGDTESTKDQRKRKYAGAFNTQEVQPGS